MKDKLKAKSCQLGVGTPCRLKQLITCGILPVDSVRLVVLVLGRHHRQVLAPSPTFPDQLASLLERFMRSSQHIRPGQTNYHALSAEKARTHCNYKLAHPCCGSRHS